MISDVYCYDWRPLWIEMKLTFFACSEGGMWFCLFRGWNNCSLLAPHTKYGIRASCILYWRMLVSAAVSYTHAEVFLRQTQYSLIFLINFHFAYIILLGLVWLLQEVLFDDKQAETSPIFPLRCATAQYRQIICVVKSDSRTLATFQNVGKARKQGEAIRNKCIGPTLFVFS